MTQESFRAGMSLYTSRAIDALKDGKPGDKIARDAMSQLVGRDCSSNGKGYPSVNSAIRFVERSVGVVWRWSKPDQCWLCLDSKQRVAETSRGIAAGRKRVYRALRVAATVNIGDLSPDEASQHSLNVATAGLMELVARGDVQKRLAASTKGSPAEPKIDAVLKLFGSTNGQSREPS